MYILDSFRIGRAYCPREASRFGMAARLNDVRPRGGALYRVWKSDPVSHRLYAEWHRDGDRTTRDAPAVSDIADSCRTGRRRMPRLHARRPARTAALLVAAFGSVVALAACTRSPAVAETRPALVRDGQRIEVPAGSPLRQRLKIAPVELHEAPHELDFPATVEADPARIANVLPALAGRVVRLDVDLGQQVKRGQLLAVIDSGDMAQAYADVAKARDALSFARETLARARGVQQAGGGAIKDVEAAHSGVVQAEAEYRRAQARVRALGGNSATQTPHPTEVRAPIAGTVTALSVAPGMFVNDPAASMLTIANIDRVWVTAHVPAEDLGLVKPGEAAGASVPAYPGRLFRGHVDSIGALLDPDSGRDRVRIIVDNADHALKPNMYARVRIAVQQVPEVFVPQSALLMNNDSTSVFVEAAPWAFERRTVELSYDEGVDARVLKGLKGGERVVVAGGVLLNDD